MIIVVIQVSVFEDQMHCTCNTTMLMITACHHPTTNIRKSVIVRTCTYIRVPTLCRYLDYIEHAVANGDTLLLENIGESVDPVLDPLLGRLTIKKGKYIKMGDKEVSVSFRGRWCPGYFGVHPSHLHTLLC